MSVDDHAMMRLEGEQFVLAELLRRRGGLTDDDVKALVAGMIDGVCSFYAARFGGAAPDVVELPPIRGGLHLAWSRDPAAAALADVAP